MKEVISNEENAIGKEKIIDKACEICGQNHFWKMYVWDKLVLQMWHGRTLCSILQ